MTNNRTIALDSVFVLLYIGLAAGMVCLSLTLAVLLALDTQFSAPHALALVINAAGWVLLAAAPSLYRRMIGAGFSWRRNVALGDVF